MCSHQPAHRVSVEVLKKPSWCSRLLYRQLAGWEWSVSTAEWPARSIMFWRSAIRTNSPQKRANTDIRASEVINKQRLLWCSGPIYISFCFLGNMKVYLCCDALSCLRRWWCWRSKLNSQDCRGINLSWVFTTQTSAHILPQTDLTHLYRWRTDGRTGARRGQPTVSNVPLCFVRTKKCQEHKATAFQVLRERFFLNQRLPKGCWWQNY